MLTRCSARSTGQSLKSLIGFPGGQKERFLSFLSDLKETHFKPGKKDFFNTPTPQCNPHNSLLH